MKRYTTYSPAPNDPIPWWRRVVDGLIGSRVHLRAFGAHPHDAKLILPLEGGGDLVLTVSEDLLMHAAAAMLRSRMERYLSSPQTEARVLVDLAEKVDCPPDDGIPAELNWSREKLPGKE